MFKFSLRGTWRFQQPPVKSCSKVLRKGEIEARVLQDLFLHRAHFITRVIVVFLEISWSVQSAITLFIEHADLQACLCCSYASRECLWIC